MFDAFTSSVWFRYLLVGLAELDVQAEVPAELHAVRFV